MIHKLCRGLAAVVSALVLGTVGGAARAAPVVLDFEDAQFVAGTIVDSQYAGAGVLISAVNGGGGPHLAAIFDSLDVGTRDPDLEFPNDAFGNLLIIQENDEDVDHDDILDLPDDEAGGGTLQFDFTQMPIASFGTDLLDIEGNENNGALQFFVSGTWEEISFADIGGLLFGDNSANTVAPIDLVAEYGGPADSVRVVFTGSGAVDNVELVFASEPVPEPSSWALVALGFTGLAVAGRQRRHGRPLQPARRSSSSK